MKHFYKRQDKFTNGETNDTNWKRERTKHGSANVSGCFIQLGFQRPQANESTITVYKWPSLKYCMYCCSISGPSVMSMSLKHCRDRPQDKQNHQMGKTDVIGHHKLHSMFKGHGHDGRTRYTAALHTPPQLRPPKLHSPTSMPIAVIHIPTFITLTAPQLTSLTSHF